MGISIECLTEDAVSINNVIESENSEGSPNAIVTKKGDRYG